MKYLGAAVLFIGGFIVLVSLLIAGVVWYRQLPSTTSYFSSAKEAHCSGELTLTVHRQPNFIEGDLVDLLIDYKKEGKEKRVFTSTLSWFSLKSAYAEPLRGIYPSVLFTPAAAGPQDRITAYVHILTDSSNFSEADFYEIADCIQRNSSALDGALKEARLLELPDYLHHGEVRFGSIIYNPDTTTPSPYAILKELNTDGVFYYSSGDVFGRVDEYGMAYGWGGEHLGDVFNGISYDFSILSSVDRGSLDFAKNNSGETLLEYVERLHRELTARGLFVR